MQRIAQLLLCVYLVNCINESKGDACGVYNIDAVSTLILSRENKAVIRDGKRFCRFGKWKEVRIEDYDCVVVELRKELEWQAELPPNVVILGKMLASVDLRPMGVSKMSFEDAQKVMTAHIKDEEARPIYRLLPGELTEALVKEVDEAINRVDAPLRIQKQREKMAKLKNRLLDNTNLLRKVILQYPLIDSEESIPDAESQMNLYSPAMRVVLEILKNEEVKIDKTTLETILDRVDWDRGDYLAMIVLGRPELDVASLRKYSEQAMSRIGKTDQALLRRYFSRKDLPKEIVDVAISRGVR